MREYFDPRSQNLPGHSPVSADEYEGSEVEYRNGSVHGNLSDYDEQNTFDNAVDERICNDNDQEDPANFRCLTPGSNLPLRGSSACNNIQHHEDDMLENISSDAMILIQDPMDSLPLADDLGGGAGHFTAGLAHANSNATQSFTNNGVVLVNGGPQINNLNDLEQDEPFLDRTPPNTRGQTAPEEGFFGTNVDDNEDEDDTFPVQRLITLDSDPKDYGEPPRSPYCDDSWPHPPSKPHIMIIMHFCNLKV